MSAEVAVPSPVGEVLELEIERPAHGGSCVAHGPDGRVVFVRHALPGERVRARVTVSKRSHQFADAIAVVRASPNRVAPPCPHAGPGRCGGCDLQHVSLPAQRAWKAAVVREQLARLAGVTIDVEVDALADPEPANPGLGWRTRVSYAVDRAGRAGLHPYHSREVLPIEACPLTHEKVRAAPVLNRPWRGVRDVEVAVGTVAGGVGAGAAIQVRITEHRARGTSVTGPRSLPEYAAGRAFTVRGFWQIHPAAADTLAAAVRDALAVQPGERALDLYAGAGLFAAGLAGSGAAVVAVEGNRQASLDAVANLVGLQVEVWHGPVEESLAEFGADGVDVVVLDPPRVGAGAAVVAGITALRPRAIAYVACDPAALARDVRSFADAGYVLSSVRGYDCFPMTHHVECVALLEPAGVRAAMS